MIGTIITAIIGGALYRVRGMGLWPSRPWWHLAFAMPYGLAAYQATSTTISIIVFALTFGAIVTGHASYIDLGTVKDGAANMPSDGEQDEWYGGWLPWHGYWHDFAGLAISGVLITASCGIAIMAYGHWSGALVAASGALKPAAYAIGWYVAERSHVSAIALGEALCGAFLWGALAWII
jgi:hypothetical protein